MMRHVVWSRHVASLYAEKRFAAFTAPFLSWRASSYELIHNIEDEPLSGEGYFASSGELPLCYRSHQSRKLAKKSNQWMGLDHAGPKSIKTETFVIY